MDSSSVAVKVFALLWNLLSQAFAFSLLSSLPRRWTARLCLQYSAAFLVQSPKVFHILPQNQHAQVLHTYPTLGTNFCFSYSSVSVIKYHVQKQFAEERVLFWLTIPSWQQEHTFSSKHNTDSVEQELWTNCELPKPIPQWYTSSIHQGCTTSPNSTTFWGPSVQIFEPLGRTFLIVTTIEVFGLSTRKVLKWPPASWAYGLNTGITQIDVTGLISYVH